MAAMKPMTLVLFGLCIGLWSSTWLALIHPAAPFFLSYPVGFVVLWRISVGGER